MEKIKIVGSDQLYEIQSIRPTSEHVLQIVFTGGVYTLPSSDRYTVWPSSRYTVVQPVNVVAKMPPAVYTWISLPQVPYEPTLAELQASKKREISQACEQAIYSGVSVELADGSTEHFACLQLC